MKNFTCLVVALLAIGIVNSQYCPAAATENALFPRINELLASTAIVAGTTVTTADTTTCVAASASFCCSVANIKTVVSGELTKIKTQLVDVGAASVKLGTNWAKIASLASTQAAAIEATTTAGELYGATAAVVKTTAAWTLAALDADFVKFKDQVVGCYAHLSSFTQRLTCFACQSAANAAGYATALGLLATATPISITPTTCAAAVTACAKVWNYLHKFGWFVHAIALANKKKDGTAATVTLPSVTTLAANYGAGFATGTAMTWADIDGAITKCGADGAASTCDAAAQAHMCRAFISPFNPAVGQLVGRSDSALFKTYDFVSKGRRALVAVSTFDIMVPSTGGIDLSTGTFSTQAITLASPVTLLAGDTTAWSTGYMAPAAGSGTTNNTTTNNTSSNSTASKSAKIVFGTIISAILAVALLN